MKQKLTGRLVLLWVMASMFAATGTFAETGHGGRNMEGGDRSRAGGMHHKHHMEHHGPGGGHREHHMEHHGPGGGHREHHAERHGRDGDSEHRGRHRRSMGKKMFARRWEETLTPEQRDQVDQLRVNHAKVNAPLKANVRLIKMNLAVLATADEPDAEAIRQSIDELLELKKKIMQQRYAHIAAVRKVLTEEQRPSYDMTVLKRTKKRKRSGRW